MVEKNPNPIQSEVTQFHPEFTYEGVDMGTPDTAQSSGESSQPTLLAGPRRTGEVALGNGAVAIYEVTSDGMKQTRIHGEPYKSAAEFHRAKGVAQPYELETEPAKKSIRKRLFK